MLKGISNFKRECFVEKTHKSRRLCDTCDALHVRSTQCVDIFDFMDAVCVGSLREPVHLFYCFLQTRKRVSPCFLSK